MVIQYFYFKITLFSYIIDFTSGKKLDYSVMLIIVFNYFVLPKKLLNVNGNEHTDL